MTDWRDLLVDDDSGLSAIFREAKTVACSAPRPTRRSLRTTCRPICMRAAIRIRPVNPEFAGRPLHDADTVVAS